MKKKKSHLILKTFLLIFAVYALFNFFSLRSQISKKLDEIDAMKEQIYELIKENRSVSGVIPKLHAMNLDQDLFGAVLEFLTAVH